MAEINLQIGDRQGVVAYGFVIGDDGISYTKFTVHKDMAEKLIKEMTYFLEAFNTREGLTADEPPHAQGVFDL